MNSGAPIGHIYQSDSTGVRFASSIRNNIRESDG
jgi:hypothetical protein